MHALAAREALELARRVDDLARVGVALVLLAQVGVARQRLVECHLGIVGDHLGDGLALPDGVVEHARGVVDRLLGLHLAVGDDVRDLFGAVDVAAVLDDVQTPLIVEVHIDIGHLGTLWREEALEEQVVFERVKTRDAKGVRHDGARCRTAARPHADAVLACPVGKLLHDQEVGREALLADDLVLVLEALDDVHALGQISVALLEAAQ